MIKTIRLLIISALLCSVAYASQFVPDGSKILGGSLIENLSHHGDLYNFTNTDTADCYDCGYYHFLNFTEPTDNREIRFEDASAYFVDSTEDYVLTYNAAENLWQGEPVTAFSSNGANCAAGSYPLGVDASGAVEDCTDASTEIDSIVATHTSDNDAHQALVTLAGEDYLSLSTQEITAIEINNDNVNWTDMTDLSAGGEVTGGDVDTATLATTVTVSDDEATNDAHEIVFTTDNANLESDGTATYNPSTGVLTTTGFAGALTGNVTGDVSGNSGTATALAANGANCNAGEYSLGVDASGAVEDCTDATTEITQAIQAHSTDDDAHHALVTLAGTPDYITLAGQTITRTKLDISDDTNATGGVGVDITANDFTFDATELTALTWSAGGSADFDWTINLSGTDPIIGFASGVVQFGDGGTTNYASFDADGDLTFTGTADYVVSNDDYAFVAASDEDTGVFFNNSTTSIDIRDTNGAAALKVGAAVGTNAGLVNPGHSIEVDGDSYSFTITGLTTTGLYFDLTTNKGVNYQYVGSDIAYLPFVGGDAGKWMVLAGLDGIGAVDLDYGSADITDHTFVSDGGTAIIDGTLTAGGSTTSSFSSAVTISDDLTVTGELDGTRVAFNCGDGGTGNADKYLKGINGQVHTADLGYTMPWAGSVVGIGNTYTVTVEADPTWEWEVYEDGVELAVNEDSPTATGYVASYTTFARDTHQFDAGDVLSCHFDLTANSGTWADNQMVFFVVFDD